MKLRLEFGQGVRGPSRLDLLRASATSSLYSFENFVTLLVMSDEHADNVDYTGKEQRRTTERRPGAGRTVSPADAKGNLGRTLFRRVGHQGKLLSDTEHKASERLAKSRDEGEEFVMTGDRRLLFKENESQVRIYRGLGWSDQEIFEVLDRLT